MAKRFNIPFATTGDKTEIPDEVQPDGSVSYTQGFGIDYEREYTDPLSKDIAREVMNQVLSDVTAALSEIQNNGVAPFSEDSKPYPQWAIVNHPTGAYISRIDDNNNDIPHSSWMQLGGTGNNDIRTNSENDGRFAQLDSDNSYTGEQTYRQPGGELLSSFASYGADSGGVQYVLGLTAVDELPSGWPDFSISGQPDPHILRLRRSGSTGAQNVRGLAVGANDATPDIGVADGFGVVCGNPYGGFKGTGTINVKEIYRDGQPFTPNAFEEFGLGQASGDVRNASGGNNDGELEFDTVGFYRSSSGAHTVFGQFGGGIVVPGHSSTTLNYLYVGSRDADDPAPARVYATTWRDDSVGLREPVEVWTSGNLQFNWNSSTGTLNIVTS